MPPTSSMRKTSLATHPTSSAIHNADANTLATSQRRTTSGRTIRSNTTRPTNYYARPFGSLSTPLNNVDGSNDANEASPPGFFPALQFFSDAITALPKEVVRQFTLMKEVEAKIHGPNETLGELVDALMELPVPTRPGAAGQQEQHALLMSLTANNSMMGSASASLVNGVAGRQLSTQHSLAGSVNGEEAGVQHTDGEAELAKRKQYHELRILAHSLLPNLDEKNVVLAEANRVLSLQLARVDSVLPHVDNEISEESRLGSMTHWAYSDNRQKKVPAAQGTNKRDVAATNNLVAAASAIHETEIALARRDAGQEAKRDKHKGRGKEHVDSDFDDKPRKTQGKLGKAKAAQQGAAVTGLGISTGAEPVKRRKLDKGLAAPGMERSQSAATKGSKVQRETPRSTPAMDTAGGKGKKTKAAPLPGKKRMHASSAQASPAMASSPLMSSANGAAAMEPPMMARTQSSRLRQNSSATNLRHEKLVDDDESSSSQVPLSATVKKLNGNGEKKTNGKRKAPADEEAEAEAADERPPEMSRKTTDKKDKEMEAVKSHEDVDMPDAAGTSRSGSGSGKAGRGSKTGTPRTENFPTDIPSMARTRSTRSMRAVSIRESSSAEPAVQGTQGSKAGRSGGHKRAASNTHILKQLAPFNRSPDLDRHLGDEDDDDDADRDGDVDMEDGEGRREKRMRVDGSGKDDQEGEEGDAEAEQRRRRPSLRKSASRPVSRRNTQTAAAVGPSSPATPTLAPRRRSDEEKMQTTTGKGDEAGGDAEEDRQEVEKKPAASAVAPLAEDESETEQQQEQPPADALQNAATAESPSPSPSPAPETMPELEPEAGPSPAAEDQDHEEEEEVEEELDVEEEEEEEEEEEDPDDPKYCYCNRGSFGEMVACDNDKCAIEWFHLGCTELREAPGEEEKWYCTYCRPATVGGGRRRGGAAGGATGRAGRGR